jgi:hypothetical protein
LIMLGAPLVILLAAVLVGLGFTSFIRTVGTVASIVLLPLIIALYPFPVANSLYADLVKQPWVPAENIALTSHEDVIGYALSSDGYWLEVLGADSRTISYYRMSDIAQRRICQIDSAAQAKPLITIVSARVVAPLCSRPTVSGAATPVPDWLRSALQAQSSIGVKVKGCMIPIPMICKPSNP